MICKSHAYNSTIIRVAGSARQPDGIEAPLSFRALSHTTPTVPPNMSFSTSATQLHL